MPLDNPLGRTAVHGAPFCHPEVVIPTATPPSDRLALPDVQADNSRRALPTPARVRQRETSADRSGERRRAARRVHASTRALPRSRARAPLQPTQTPDGTP